jgi:hypothetical protein
MRLMNRSTEKRIESLKKEVRYLKGLILSIIPAVGHTAVPARHATDEALRLFNQRA